MATPFDKYEKKKDYLVCVDSDGCAMDTMNIKHIRCFGPCMVAEWHLHPWQEAILNRWNDINLYTLTRGINRFKGLAMALEEIHQKIKPIDNIEALISWVEKAPELSNRSVSKALEETGNPIFGKALAWSVAVNRAINALPESEKLPFTGTAGGLAAAHKAADVAVVSSANRDAVEEEWQRFGLMENVDILLCQEAGSKAYCIGELLNKGYMPDHVLMMGDAPGDLDAAERNGVFYYPILVRREVESWAEAPEAFRLLTSGGYAAYGEKKKREFLDNLRGE